MANSIDEMLMADRKRQGAGSDADQRRQEEMNNANQLRLAQMAARDGERQTGEQAGGQSGSFRDRWRVAKRAMDLKQKAKDKLEEKVAAPASKLSTKFLNFIPSYGPYVAFKRFIAGKKSKFNLVDIIIMLFSNLTACFMVLAVLAFIALIVTWATNPLTAVKAIMDLGWGAVSALVNLFKGLLSVK